MAAGEKKGINSKNSGLPKLLRWSDLNYCFLIAQGPVQEDEGPIQPLWEQSSDKH
jgi:hypothetical protein